MRMVSLLFGYNTTKLKVHGGRNILRPTTDEMEEPNELIRRSREYGYLLNGTFAVWMREG